MTTDVRHLVDVEHGLVSRRSFIAPLRPRTISEESGTMSYSSKNSSCPNLLRANSEPLSFTNIPIAI